MKLVKLCADETVANGSQVCWIDGFVIVDYNDFSARINDEKTGKLYWVQRKHTQKVKIRPFHLEDDYESADTVIADKIKTPKKTQSAAKTKKMVSPEKRPKQSRKSADGLNISTYKVRFICRKMI